MWISGNTSLLIQRWRSDWMPLLTLRQASACQYPHLPSASSFLDERIPECPGHCLRALMSVTRLVEQMSPLCALMMLLWVLLLITDRSPQFASGFASWSSILRVLTNVDWPLSTTLSVVSNHCASQFSSSVLLPLWPCQTNWSFYYFNRVACFRMSFACTLNCGFYHLDWVRSLSFKVSRVFFYHGFSSLFTSEYPSVIRIYPLVLGIHTVKGILAAFKLW